MHTELTALTARLDRLEQDNHHLTVQFRQAQRKMRVQMALALAAVVGAILISPANQSALAQGYGVTLATLNARLTAVEAKTQFQSADSVAQSTTFSGCNVIVNDGGGATAAVVTNSAGEGIGNLIIGYNTIGHVSQGGNAYQEIRTGSHNLILGDQQNYASFGGLVAGDNNTISAPYASVTGGEYNTADGRTASVSGGYSNKATLDGASVIGGQYNTASGAYSAVSGGLNNTANGDNTSVSGGFNNSASGSNASVSGGLYNSAGGSNSTVSGGFNNTASGTGSSVSGGFVNTQPNGQGLVRRKLSHSLNPEGLRTPCAQRPLFASVLVAAHLRRRHSARQSGLRRPPRWL